MKKGLIRLRFLNNESSGLRPHAWQQEVEASVALEACKQRPIKAEMKWLRSPV